MSRFLVKFLALGMIIGASAAYGIKSADFHGYGATEGVCYPYGGATVTSKYIPNTEVTAAAIDNLKRVGAGGGDLGYAYPDNAIDEIEGKGMFKSKLPIRLIAHLYVSCFHLVRADGSPIRSVADLRGKKVSLGAPKSGTKHVSVLVPEAFGIEHQKNIKRDRLTVVESAAALKGGKVDTFFWAGGFRLLPSLTSQQPQDLQCALSPRARPYLIFSKSTVRFT